MHYLYCDLETSGDSLRLEDAGHIHHLRDVLRMKAGQQITVCDRAGRAVLCTIDSLDRKAALLKIENRTAERPKKTGLALACAVPKLAGMDDIIDKLTQLEVDVIIPMQTERTVIQLEGERLASRLERWRKISRSAVEQSHRRSLPRITSLMHFPGVLEFAREYELRLIPTLTGSRKMLKELSGEIDTTPAIVLIGPEGDFTPGEVETALESGFTAVSLGETVLRVDTAAIAIASFFRLNRQGLE